MFNTFGIPEEIKSDNGPLSNGSKFSIVAQEQGFIHRKVTTAWAEANGDIERYMQTLKKSPKIARFERKTGSSKNHWQLSCYAPPSDKADPGPAYVGKRVM